MSLLAKVLDFRERQLLFSLGLSSLIEAKLVEFKQAKEQANHLKKKEIAQEIEKILLEKKKENYKKENLQKEPLKKYFDQQLKLEIQHKTEEVVIKDQISAMFDFIDQKLDNFLEPSLDYDPLREDYLDFWQLTKFDWTKIDLNKCAVLYRTHSQSRAIEEVFLKYKVPYRLVSGTKFLDRKEVKDVLALLKFLANSQDKIAISRFLPLVLEGVGAKTLDKILAFLEDFDYPLPPKQQSQITNFLNTLQQAWQEKLTLASLTEYLLDKLGYYDYLRKSCLNKEEFTMRQENIKELYSLMLPFDQDQTLDLTEKLQNFLQQISLMNKEEVTENEKQAKITLMTLHQSKGLEFETVFLVGCEDGLLPHQNSFFEQDAFEEEVRLAYVGVTRAKKFLYLTMAKTRTQFGQIKANPISSIFRPFLGKYILQDNSKEF